MVAAHGQGIVHRDLTPADIMIEKSGQPVITEFGLASVDEGAYGSDNSNGTPLNNRWVSPLDRMDVQVASLGDSNSVLGVGHK